ncbi:MAG: MBL fold metallo-hydrolase [Chloroflexi bacterium]|nr:MBL fold metallo-hydrolase [Chloroflexota bacterium]
MQLIDNLYAYVWKGWGNNAHSYLFRDVLSGARPHVIVDPGYVVNEIGEACLKNLVALMARDGIKAEEIGLIINTHSHVDHCGASEAIASMGKDGDRAHITLTEVEDAYRRTTGLELHKMIGLRIEEFEPDFYIREGDFDLVRGGKTFPLQIVSTPGHCPGSISVYDPVHGALITGDAVFNGSIGRTDFPGGDGAVLKRSIEKLAELDVEYLLPGHSTEFGDIIRGKDRVKKNFEFIRKNYFPLI